MVVGAVVVGAVLLGTVAVGTVAVGTVAVGTVAVAAALLGAGAALSAWLAADTERLARFVQRGAARALSNGIVHRAVVRRCGLRRGGRAVAVAYRLGVTAAASRVGLVGWRRVARRGVARRGVGPGLVALALLGSVPSRRR